MDPVIRKIREELEANRDEAASRSFPRFFREEVKYYGVKTGTVTKIARKYWIEVRLRTRAEIFDLCEELYRSGYTEEAFIVSAWVPELEDRFEPGDITIFRHWIDAYITNWAACDSFCNHAVGDFIMKYPASVAELKRWTRSGNRWMRRAAAVSLIVPAKRGKFLADVLEIADLLLTDPDNMVQKGYGWLLKEASRLHREEVYSFVIRHKKVMPRTALRYAIDLMPKDMKAEAMKKG